MFEVNKERRQYAESLRAVIDLHRGDCHESSAPILAAVQRLADLLQAGRLSLLRPIFRAINKRLFGTPNSRAISDQHAVLRRKLRVMRTTAKNYAQDPELAELAYVLATVNKALGLGPERTTLLLDRATRGTYAQYFHDVVMAAADAASPDPAAAILSA